jgi:hypothetical protein
MRVAARRAAPILARMTSLSIGRFVVRASTARPPVPFSKMDLVRTKRRLAVSALPASFESFVTTLGAGALEGGWAEILAPDEVVARTETLRATGIPGNGPFADRALLAGVVVVATFSFGDALAWIGARDRFVRVPTEPTHAVSDYGADLATALDMGLHLMGAPAALELAAPT